jgi:hypothetical protein
MALQAARAHAHSSVEPRSAKALAERMMAIIFTFT